MPASIRKPGVQPKECRTKAKGSTLNSCPSWPDMPVSWVTSGTRAGANHSGISRITEIKVMASPAPTRTRPATPPGMVSAKASWSWPRPIRTAPPAIMAREPNLSTRSAHGDLQACVDQQLQDGEEGDGGRAGMEPLGGLQPHHAERRALGDGHQVRENADGPDQPGSGCSHPLIMPGLLPGPGRRLPGGRRGAGYGRGFSRAR